MRRRHPRKRKPLTPLKLKRRRQVSYLIRNIDGELWDAVRARADEEGQSLRWVIRQLLFIYANREIDFGLD